jgi:hypothetical protein
MSRVTDSHVTITLTSDMSAVLSCVVVDAMPRLKPEARAVMNELAAEMLSAIADTKARVVHAYGSLDAAAAAAASHLETHPWIDEPWA